MSSMASSAAASPISGLEPAPSPSVRLDPSWMRFSVPEAWRAWASVLATMKSAPASPAAIMLLTAFPPAPPTPMTAMRGLMFLSPSKALSEPLSHTPQVTLCLQSTLLPVRSRSGIEGDLDQAHARGERRTHKSRRQAFDRLHPRDTHRPRKEISRQLAQPGLLADPTGQHDTLGITGRIRTLQ